MAENKKIEVDFASSYKDLKLLKRRWFPLWKLDGYVLKEFLIKYAILMLVFSVLFILSDFYRDVSDFLEAKMPIRDVIKYLLYRLPGNIRFIMPISMLLGCMWTMATFGKNLEVTAMRASGVSLLRCGGAILAMGLFVTGVNIYFNEVLIPETSVEAEKLYDVGTKSDRYSKSLLTYKSVDGKRRWLFQLFVVGEKQTNVTLKTKWDQVMIAKLIGTPGTPEFEAHLREITGPRFAELPPLNEPEKRSLAITRLLEGRKIDFTIDEAHYDYDTSEWVFDKGSFTSYDRAEEVMFQESRGTIIFHQPISFANVRFSEAEIPERPEKILNAVKEKDNLSTPLIWQILKENPDMPRRAKCIYETVFYYRLAFPWSCFLAVFLGIPLATRNERTGSMLAIISAIALIVIYIAIAQFFLMLGKSGALDPMLCGLAPTVAFIIAGAVKIVHDKV
ncbi:MAG: LptF/LptG family permease [Lentisphaeria bacterium]|nr:LptF/LptG family permease [Lentisphaeria bacterium]